MAKPKVAAFGMLHYGAPYLAYAVASLYPQVEKIFIAYTDSPSQSFNTDLTCPDDRETLLKLIEPYKDKIEWLDGHWQHEGEHCDAARAMAAEYDWLVRFDSDEIFPVGSVNHYLKQAIADDQYQQWRMPFLHFWRSFGKVCRDASFPVRLEHRSGSGTGWLDSGQEKYSIIHMGYAMPTPYIVYKMQVQGHRSEWRPDWFEQRWLVNAQEDVHPVIFRPAFWNTEDFDRQKLPKILHNHPYFNEDLIA